MRRTLILVALAAGALAAATSAGANHGTLPWYGGQAFVTEFEKRAAEIASTLAERPVTVICNGTTDWSALAAQGGFDGRYVWGYVVFGFDRRSLTWKPLDYTHLSEQACWYLDELWGAPDKRAVTKGCETGTSVEYETRHETRRLWKWKKKRVEVGGKRVVKRVRVRVTVEVAVEVRHEVPLYGDCPDYEPKLLAVQTLAHESMHLFGIDSEGIAECYGMQLFAHVAQSLGFDVALSAEMAADYWQIVYRNRPVASEYVRSDCVDGSRWDLHPESSIWPSG